MQENIVLAFFLALPALLALILYAFARKLRRQTRRVSWLSLITGNVLVLLALCSIVLLSGEIYYRFCYDKTDSFGLTKITKRWFDRHFRTNNINLRDSVDYHGMILPGKRRVTIIGDSFTAGHGIPSVEDRFANRLRAFDARLEVHVVADCGWDTGEELRHVDSIAGSDYQWDTAVLVYCLNDVADIVPEWATILRRVYRTPDPGYFVTNSYFLDTIYRRWQVSRDPDVSNYYQFVTANYEGPVWTQQQGRLTSLKSKIESSGGRLMVVTFPFLHALGPDYKYAFIHERLNQFWDSLKVPHLDLLEIYKSHTPDELVVSPYDAHPNERAHAMAAAAIAEFLKKQPPTPKEPD